VAFVPTCGGHATLVTDTPDRQIHVLIKPEASRWPPPRAVLIDTGDRCGTKVYSIYALVR